VATAHIDGSLRVWSRYGDPIMTRTVGDDVVIGALHVTPEDGWLIAAAGEQSRRDVACPVVAFDTRAWNEGWRHPVTANNMALSPDGKRVALVTPDAVLVLDDRGALQSQLPARGVTAVGWSPSDGGVTTAMGPLIAHEGRALGGAEVTVSHIAWAPDGRRLAAGDSLWTFSGAGGDTPAPKRIGTLWTGGRGAPISAYHIIAGGRLLIAGRARGIDAPQIAWVDMLAGEVRAVIEVASLDTLAIGGDGALLVTSTVGRVELWGIEYDWAFAEDMLDELDAPASRGQRLWSARAAPAEIAADLARAARRSGLATESFNLSQQWITHLEKQGG
jgi:hypothetical protein